VEPSLIRLAAAVEAAGVSDPRVLDAVRAVPREWFVPPDQVSVAYVDQPIRIPHGQVTTQPSLSARMLEGLALRGNEHVLEVGTGLGYQTALLARLAADVVSIERWPDLVEQAARNLRRQRIGNVRLMVGDGSQGAPEHAPYDAIVVSAAFPEVPPPLIEQLKVGGRLVQPVGSGGNEEVILFQRSAEDLVPQQVLTLARFVRLYGRYGFPPERDEST
jgi:protein-L-isoaspartate(D-aspartate) O-methyltransferase